MPGLLLGITILREAHTFRTVPPKWLLVPLWTLFVGGPVAHGMNLAGALRGPGPTLYLTGLLCWLAAGAIMFALIVLLRPRASTTMTSVAVTAESREQKDQPLAALEPVMAPLQPPSGQVELQ